MNLSDQISTLRGLLGDKSKPYLWSDDELRTFANEAQNEAAERGQLILDITTPEVCVIAVRAGVRTYPLHPSIIKIKRAKLDLGSRPLVETSTEQMDESGCGGSNWDTLTGQPERFIQNGAASITLIRIPVTADTLRMRVTRLPLCPMKADKDAPEIAERYHFRMLDWALRCAYLKQDNETLDENKALKYETSFTQAFGARPDANVQRKRRERPHAVRMGIW